MSSLEVYQNLFPFVNLKNYEQSEWVKRIRMGLRGKIPYTLSVIGEIETPLNVPSQKIIFRGII